MSRARGHLALLTGGGIVMALLLLALLAPFLPLANPTRGNPAAVLAAPSAAYWFGADGNGMDLFARCLHGAAFAFLVAVPATVLGAALGLPLGLIAGYAGGLIDEALLRVLDVLRVFPAIILALALVAVTGPSLLNVVLVIGLVDAPVFARLVRAETLALRRSPMVEAQIAIGAPTWRILFLRILPNSLRGALSQMPVRAAWAVRINATLAFVGVGLQPPTPEWGAMIRHGAEYMVTGHWWVVAAPGGALLLLVLGFNLLADGVQQALDPRGRGRQP
jgi:peptide/nickel transport system permease protein